MSNATRTSYDTSHVGQFWFSTSLRITEIGRTALLCLIVSHWILYASFLLTIYATCRPSDTITFDIVTSRMSYLQSVAELSEDRGLELEVLVALSALAAQVTKQHMNALRPRFNLQFVIHRAFCSHLCVVTCTCMLAAVTRGCEVRP